MSETSRITSAAVLMRTEGAKETDQVAADLSTALAELFEYIGTMKDPVLLEKAAHAADAITVALTE